MKIISFWIIGLRIPANRCRGVAGSATVTNGYQEKQRKTKDFTVSLCGTNCDQPKKHFICGLTWNVKAKLKLLS